MAIGRRSLIRKLWLSTLAVGAAACTPRPPRPQPPEVALPPEFDRVNQEARGILSDVLESLRTFDAYSAYRVTSSSASDMRLSSELNWDPPTSAEWDEASHVGRSVRGRAEQIFQFVASVKVDPTRWREQRALADATHELLDLGDALSAYRDRIDVLPPGDGASALPLLDQAWTQWTVVAARWSISRSESIPCGT